jgi:hypothetical protein
MSPRACTEYKTVLVVALIFLAGLVLFVPWRPLVLTSYYEYCMHIATAEAWQFGVDIFSTYGPLGFVGLPFYRSSTYPSLIMAHVCLYGIMVILLWEFWRSTITLTRPSALWIVFILLLPGLGPAREWSPLLFLPYILVNLFTLWHFLGPSSEHSRYFALMTFVLALFVLVKVSLILLSLIAIAVVTVDQLTVSRKRLWIVPGFALSILLLWVLSGQRLDHIVAYLSSGIDIVAGYKDGLASSEGTRLGPLPFIYAIGSLGLVGALCFTLYKRLGWRTLGPAITLSATLFVAFQNGFVRQDTQHIVPAGLVFCVLCALVLPLLWVRSDSQIFLRTVLVSIGLTGFVFLGTCWLSGFGTPRMRVLTERVVGDSGLPAELMTEEVYSLDTAREAHLQSLRRTYPIPLFSGSMESSTVDVGIAEAHGYMPRFRPTVTLFAATTPALVHKNVSYLAGASGPATIIIPIQPAIDGRYPASDGLGLLAQKAHYRFVGSSGELLLLRRRGVSLPLHFTRLQTLEASFDEVVSVPNTGNDVIYLRLKVEPTLAGRAFSLLYKPAPIFISVRANGSDASYRLATATAEEGLVLSPFLYDLQSFKDFYSDSPSALNVSSFRIWREKEREWSYDNKIKIELFRVEAD